MHIDRNRSLLQGASGLRILLLVVLLVVVANFSAMTLPVFVSSSSQPEVKKSAPRKKGGNIIIRHADKLVHNEDSLPGVQIFTGNVEFYHDGTTLKCDSANYYQETNSFIGWKNVRLIQGDTLSLKCGFLHYDGTSDFAKARTRGVDKVVLTHRGSTLYTDSLDYDHSISVAWFFDGGKLIDNGNILTSDWGQYNSGDRQAVFYYNVELTGKDNSVLSTDTLYYDVLNKKARSVGRSNLKGKDYELVTDVLNYNTATKDANVQGPSNVYQGNTNIYTENGFFNTKTGKAILYDRSRVNDNGSKMEGDTLIYYKDKNYMEGFGNVIYQNPKDKTDLRCNSFNYDKNTGFIQGFGNVVFNDDKEHRRLVCNSFTYNKLTGVAEGFGNVAYNDTINKLIITGNYCHHNDSLGYSYAYDSALVVSYSEPDTLYLHADTLKVLGYNLKTDSVYRIVQGFHHARSYRKDVQSVADSLAFNTKDRILALHGNPIVWQDRNQIIGEEIYTYFNDSSHIDSIYVVNQALLCEKLDSIHYNQVAGREMRIYFEQGQLRESRAIQNVNVNYFQYDDNTMPDSIIIAMNHAETSLLKIHMKDKKVSDVWTAETDGMFYPIIFVTPKLMYLDNFAWFDYIRPKNKQDVFVWRNKSADKILQKTKRREVPHQKLKSTSQSVSQ